MSKHDEPNDTTPQSRWGRDFWAKYHELSSLVANLASYGGHALIPTTKASKHLQRTEHQLTHVAGLLAPKRNEITELWTTPVTTVTIAIRQSGQLVERDQELSLETAADWTTATTIVETEKPQRGGGTEEQPTRGYLPPAAIKQLFRQLTEVINRLGWTEDAATQDYVARDNEVLRHE